MQVFTNDEDRCVKTIFKNHYFKNVLFSMCNIEFNAITVSEYLIYLVGESELESKALTSNDYLATVQKTHC